MECPACKHKFGYRSVPLENRVIEAKYTIFMCPNCTVWLKPTGLYSYLTIGGLSLLLISAIVFIFYLKNIGDVFAWLAPLLAISGIAAFMYGAIAIKLIKLSPEEVGLLPIVDLDDMFDELENIDELAELEAEKSSEHGKDKF